MYICKRVAIDFCFADLFADLMRNFLRKYLFRLLIDIITQKVISLFPSLPSLVCRHCGGVLRLWPAQVLWDYMIIIGASL